MKRFVFRQDALLRIKRQLRHQAELRLARAQAQLTAARTEQANRQRELEQHSGRAFALGAVTASKVWQTHRAVEYLTARILEMNHVIANHVTEVKQAVTALQQATRDVEALEALRQHYWKAYRQELLVERQNFMDEMALGQWFRHSLTPMEETKHD